MITNRLLRSITFASTSFAMVTVISSLAISSTNPKDKSANTIGVYASILAFVAGAGFGFGSKSNFIQTRSKFPTRNTSQSWRDFVVVRKHPESNDITSFYLQPIDDRELANFQPGQFLTIKLDIPKIERSVIRAYSLSDYPLDLDYYRLSIKKQGPPKDLNVPGGVVSNYMHAKISEGSIISCKSPSGKFYIDIESSAPALLISNGVGITPMISMAEACVHLNPMRHIWFIHGARNGKYHAFREEMENLTKLSPNLHIHYSYSKPNVEDAGKYHSQGYIDKKLLQNIIVPQIEIFQNQSSAQAEYFLCGSPPFMDSLIKGLKELNIPEDKIFFESFGGGKTKGKSGKHQALRDKQIKSSSLELKTKKLHHDEPSSAGVEDFEADITEVESLAADRIDKAEVVFAASNRTLTWRSGDGSLLEFAEANDLKPEYSCRQGFCMSCVCQLLEGKVEYIETPSEELEEDSVLTCIAIPKTAKVILDL